VKRRVGEGRLGGFRRWGDGRVGGGADGAGRREILGGKAGGNGGEQKGEG